LFVSDIVEIVVGGKEDGSVMVKPVSRNKRSVKQENIKRSPFEKKL
jgi:hypothetical protein